MNNLLFPLLLVAMFLTAIVETFLFWCFRYRDWKVLSYFFILNLISNLLVNLAYQNLWGIIPKNSLILSLEVAVVLFEACLLGVMTGHNKKLWLSVFLTNLCSFLLGVLLLGI